MPLWRYVGISGSRTLRGEMEAPDRAALVDRLMAQGVSPLSVDEGVDKAGRPGGGRLASLLTRPLGRPSDAAIAGFIGELADLTGAGISVERALTVIVAQPRPPAMAAAADAVLRDLRGGASLAGAMQGTAVFPRAVIGVLRAGEASGALPEVLARLADTLAAAGALRETVRSAMIYPLVLLVLVGGVVGLMAFVVLPQFEGLFEDAGDAVPAGARLVMDGAAWLRAWWWLPPVLLVLAVAGGAAALARPAPRRVVHARLLRLPLVGRIEAARLCRLLGTLLENGVALPAALGIARDATANAALADALGDVALAVREGQRLSAALNTLRLPPLVGHLATVGEETGRLGPMLHKAAGLLEAAARRDLARAVALLVPVLTIVLGGIVAAVMGAVMSALLSIYDMPL